METESLNRKLSLIGIIFALINVLLGSIGLITNYWSLKIINLPGKLIETSNGTILLTEKIQRKWNGLFYFCDDIDYVKCIWNFKSTIFIICLIGLIFSLIASIFLYLNMKKIINQRLIVPILFFFACVLITAGIFEYGSSTYLNSHSSQIMIIAMIFAYLSLSISAFIAGRYFKINQVVTNKNITDEPKSQLKTTN